MVTKTFKRILRAPTPKDSKRELKNKNQKPAEIVDEQLRSDEEVRHEDATVRNVDHEAQRSEPDETPRQLSLKAEEDTRDDAASDVQLHNPVASDKSFDSTVKVQAIQEQTRKIDKYENYDKYEEKEKDEKKEPEPINAKQDNLDEELDAIDAICDDDISYTISEGENESEQDEAELFEVEAQELPSVAAQKQMLHNEQVKSLPKPRNSQQPGNNVSFNKYRKQSTPTIPRGCSLLFVAIARHEPGVEFNIVSRYCENSANFEESDYVTCAYHNLADIEDENYSTIFASVHGNWFVKSDHGFIYIVVATSNYPRYFAVEVVDSLSNIITSGRDAYKKRMQRGRFNNKNDKRNLVNNINEWKHGLEFRVSSHERRNSSVEKQRAMKKELQDYCEIIFKEYKEMQEGSKAYRLHHDIDGVKDKMSENIDALLQKSQSLHSIEETCQSLLESSKVFKKEAKREQKKVWLDDKGMLILGAGTAGAVAVGAIIGFLAGGPGGAAVVALPSVAVAEAIEASVLAAACGLAYFATAKAAVHTWFWSKKFRKVVVKK